MSEALSSSPVAAARAGRARATARRGRRAPPRGRGRPARRAAGRRRAARSGGSRAAGRRRVQDGGVDPGQRVGEPLALGAVHERRELHELEVAHDAVGDVEVGVEPQLAQARAHPRQRAQEVVAQRDEGGVEGLVGAEELLLAVVPLGAERRPRLLGEGGRGLHGARVRVGRVGQDEPLVGARHRQVQQPPHLVDVHRARVGRQGLVQQRVGDRLGAAPAGARHSRGVQAADEDVAEGRPAGGVHGQHRHRARVDPVLRLGLVVLQPGLGHRGDVAREVARGRLRRAADVGGGEVARAAPGPGGARRRRPARRRAPAGAARGGRRGGGRRGRAATCPARRPPTGAAAGSRARARAPRAGAGATPSRRRARSPCRACAGARSGRSARGRWRAARPGRATARGRPRRRRRGRRAAAARPGRP